MAVLIIPTLATGRRDLDLAFRIAIGDVVGNLQPLPDRDALLEGIPAWSGGAGGRRTGLMAGLEYGLWTRDAAINAWNGLAWLDPHADRASLSAALVDAGNDQILIGGQYWDAVIWGEGAWAHYRHTGDREFLATAHAALDATLAAREGEYDPELGLYRGPAVYGDGCSAYPDAFATASGAIADWATDHPDDRDANGIGIPLRALSTNVCYYRALVIVGLMATELGAEASHTWRTRADALAAAIDRQFARQGWRYLAGPHADNAQEGLGIAYAVLAGLCQAEPASTLLRQCRRSPWGIACLDPVYPRYQRLGAAGRHCGTVWPHINALFAAACASVDAWSVFEDELAAIAGLAVRHGYFPELVDGQTGDCAGGVQEFDGDLTTDWAAWSITGVVGHTAAGHRVVGWKAMRRQSWCATGYLRLLVGHVAGLDFTPLGLRVTPRLPAGVTQLDLRGIAYRGRRLRLRVDPAAREPLTCNGRTVTASLLGLDQLPDGDLDLVARPTC